MADLDSLRADLLNKATAATADAAAAVVAATKASQAAIDTATAAYALDAALEDLEPAPEPEPEPDPGLCTWLSGVDVDNDPDQLPEFETFGNWRGLKVRGGLTYHGAGFFGPGKTWGAMANSTVIRKGGEIDRLLSRPEKYFVSHAQPLLLSDEKQKFSLLASGSLDDEHRAVAAMLAAVVGDRWERFTVRLGWEWSKGYPWSGEGAAAAELAQFKPGFQRIAKIYKAEFAKVGATCLIIWNNLRNTTLRLGNYYPGDDVVDIIGCDTYDNGFGGNVVDEAAWKKFAGFYDPETGNIQGPQGFADFAKARGKEFAVEEWGATCQNANGAPDGSNNDFFVPRMVKFFQSLGSLLVFECYFNGPPKHQICPPTSTQPKVSVAYKAAYEKLHY